MSSGDSVFVLTETCSYLHFYGADSFQQSGQNSAECFQTLCLTIALNHLQLFLLNHFQAHVPYMGSRISPNKGLHLLY